MNTLRTISINIKNITMDIHDRYPELYRFIDEMPVTIPDQQNPQIGIDNLETYFDSLSFLQEGYLINKTDKTQYNSTKQMAAPAHWPEDGYPLYPVEKGHFRLLNEEKEFLK